MTSIKPWPVNGARLVAQNRIFTLKTLTARSPRTGTEHDFYVLEAGAWVNIIPVTEHGEVLLVRQYRHGTREITLEIPGGLVEDGQSPEEAARRELLEETGYRADSFALLARVRPNPAILDNWCYCYLAENAVRTNEVEQDDAEDLETVKVPAGRYPADDPGGRDRPLAGSVRLFPLLQPRLTTVRACKFYGRRYTWIIIVQVIMKGRILKS